MMGLADLAVYVAVFSRTGLVPMAVTSELKITFLRPAIGADVLTRAELRNLRQRTAFAVVDLNEAGREDRLVANATATYVLPVESQ